MKAKEISNITLEVTYYSKLMLRSSSYGKKDELNSFELSILDEEMDTTTGKTTMQFYEIKELEEIITDFKNKLNNLNKL